MCLCFQPEDKPPDPRPAEQTPAKACCCVALPQDQELVPRPPGLVDSLSLCRWFRLHNIPIRQSSSSVIQNSSAPCPSLPPTKSTRHCSKRSAAAACSREFKGPDTSTSLCQQTIGHTVMCMIAERSDQYGDPVRPNPSREQLIHMLRHPLSTSIRNC